GVACPSATQCTAIDVAGRQVTFDPASPGTPTPTPTTIDTGHDLIGVACASATRCIAVDGDGRQVTFDPASPGAPTLTTIDLTTLTAIACVSADECTAVDATGYETTARAISTTSLACSPSSLKTGTATTCTATVTDTQPGGATPSGTVSFTSSRTSGHLANTGRCTLQATATTGIASCRIVFTPSAVASYTLTGNYSGDNTHLVSSGRSKPITATAPGRARVKHISTSGATISVGVSCTGSTPCNIRLTASVLETIHGGKVIALAASTKSTKKTITIVSKTATILAGATKTINLTLNDAGKQLLAKNHPLKAKLTVTQSRKTVTSKTITLR
ncbi:MAG TPA: hypothetical protein VME70_08825, partial [Mycobacteriales bacterium]|nr:hypothetical protein [Mycobacteriales bacterium]